MKNYKNIVVICANGKIVKSLLINICVRKFLQNVLNKFIMWCKIFYEDLL